MGIKKNIGWGLLVAYIISFFAVFCFRLSKADQTEANFFLSYWWVYGILVALGFVIQWAFNDK